MEVGMDRKGTTQTGSAVYVMGLIGALVFYIQGAHGFWAVVLGILKALVWPAFLVYHVLKFVGA
jgi:hypothetical protein